MLALRRSFRLLPLSILFFLAYFLLKPYFSADEARQTHPDAQTITANPLNSVATSPTNDALFPATSLSPITTEDPLSGQRLELGQAQSLQVSMFGNRDFLDEQYSFVPSEKVFLVMDFAQLEAGEHHLSAQWKAPDGQVINTSRHTISLTEHAPKHRSFLWLKLMKNGFFSEMLTGKQYKGEIHGQWEAEIYFNGERITSQPFMIFL